MKKYSNIAFMALTLFIISYQIVSAQVTTSEPGCNYIQNYLSFGSEVASDDILKLQLFLNSHENEKLSTNGIFRMETKQAVERFQMKYKDSILAPWGITSPTGYVFITTKNKINELYCGEKIAYTNWEKSILFPSKIAEKNTNTEIKTEIKNNVDKNIVILNDNALSTSTDTNDANIISTSSTSGSILRNIFSSPFALVILLILLAIVVYLMMTGKDDDLSKPI
ncbi:MAG: peptidoglycan-binding protein [Patescibacteria group bacterium]|nr:peptidoglycan-binding protein [Patescibacteria group bacterium]